MAERQFKSFAEFWPYYLGEHREPATRTLHCVGSLLAIAIVVAFIMIGKGWLFPLALITGYAFAWIGHFFIEKNRTAIFTYPLSSFMVNMKMLALILT